MLKSLLLAFTVLALVVLAPVEAQNQSLAQVLQSNSQTTQFFNITNTTNPSIISLLQGGNNTNATYTVFAPADSAITPQIAALLRSANNLQSILLYHVVNGSYPSSSLQSGPNIYDSLANGAVLKWSNGTGLPLDVVKGSSSSSSSPSNSSANITVSDGINSVNVIQIDTTASNGVIYIIDGILSLPQAPWTTTQQNIQGGEEIVIFGQTLNTTNLASTVDNQDGETIFAPIDAAFAHTNLSGLSSDTLSKILKFHVVNQVYYTTNLTNLTINGPINITTSEGENLTITVSGTDITVGNENTTAKVVQSNVLVDNGVIHIIDKILFPMNLTNGNGSNNGSNNGNGNPNAAPALRGFELPILLSVVAVAFSLLI